jgi:hypothetical protein
MWTLLRNWTYDVKSFDQPISSFVDANDASMKTWKYERVEELEEEQKMEKQLHLQCYLPRHHLLLQIRALLVLVPSLPLPCLSPLSSRRPPGVHVLQPTTQSNITLDSFLPLPVLRGGKNEKEYEEQEQEEQGGS